MDATTNAITKQQRELQENACILYSLADLRDGLFLGLYVSMFYHTMQTAVHIVGSVGRPRQLTRL